MSKKQIVLEGIEGLLGADFACRKKRDGNFKCAKVRKARGEGSVTRLGPKGLVVSLPAEGMVARGRALGQKGIATDQKTAFSEAARSCKGSPKGTFRTCMSDALGGRARYKSGPSKGKIKGRYSYAGNVGAASRASAHKPQVRGPRTAKLVVAATKKKGGKK